ncbi:alpha/beta hydrolase [Actinotalea sp. M2MS4P-6]|uniref:alpha/beta fold hydrolase n=1 Tax=Actinotalea sp. M2MS4P-6 TaxID=2983762 RepID=UPI0021E48920|nr:alpha/beta hydrolase [Actinotalea sp. M2MS4P-6]MCV2395515.1 alpha/beta hydrolase [Actinotalea sp. M2MS4P-6]
MAATPQTLQHVEHGTGTPVLAVHGWGPDHRIVLGCLEPVFSARPGYRRLYPDLPGMGRTPAEVDSADGVLAALLGFVDAAIGEEPFLLVGESYGGYLARAVARARPGQVLGLAQICPVGPVARTERDVPPLQVLWSEPDGVDGPPNVVAAFADLAVVRSREALARFTEHVHPGLVAADQAALARIARSWSLSDDPDAADLPPFERPSLVLLGRQDSAVGYRDQLTLHTAWPRATLAVLDVAGHNLQLEQPAVFEALMVEWLDRVAGRRPR